LNNHLEITNKPKMSPIALTEDTGPSMSSSKYHAESSDAAMSIEAKYAAHNYHPLPIVFAKARGASVWDPVCEP
jgi:ornithine--oxo-acid transaminase